MIDNSPRKRTLLEDYLLAILDINSLLRSSHTATHQVVIAIILGGKLTVGLDDRKACRGTRGNDDRILIIAFYQMKILEACYLGRSLAQSATILEGSVHHLHEVDFLQIHVVALLIHRPVNIEGGVIISIE